MPIDPELLRIAQASKDEVVQQVGDLLAQPEHLTDPERVHENMLIFLTSLQQIQKNNGLTAEGMDRFLHDTMNEYFFPYLPDNIVLLRVGKRYIARRDYQHSAIPEVEWRTAHLDDVFPIFMKYAGLET